MPHARVLVFVALRPSAGLFESETLVHAAEDDTWKLNPMHACLGSTRTA